MIGKVFQPFISNDDNNPIIAPFIGVEVIGVIWRRNCSKCVHHQQLFVANILNILGREKNNNFLVITRDRWDTVEGLMTWDWFIQSAVLTQITNNVDTDRSTYLVLAINTFSAAYSNKSKN